MAYILSNLLCLSALLIITGRCDSCINDVKHEESFRNSLDKLLTQVMTATGVHENGDTYDYQIGVCAEPSAKDMPGCAVVQEKRLPNGDLKKVCVGRLNSTTVIESPGGWIELSYGNGTQYSSHCGQSGRVARLLFDCDPFAGKGKPEFVEENNQDTTCYYLFYWRTREMCDNSLSPGAIIMIIFAVLLGIWLIAMIGGFLYLRFVVGAKGYEQIPCYSYYQEFGNLEADGCDLVCRSRGSIPASMHKPPVITNTTPGPKQDLDSETDEDDRDDTLLPM